MRQIYKQKLFGFILIAGVLISGLLGLSGKTAYAANPTTINFQGKVVNSNATNVTDGSYTFIFRLQDSSNPANIGTNCSDNSNCWWEETDSLTVTSGVFQVELGSAGGCVFTNACNSTHSGIDWNTNNALYLTMKFNGDTSGSYHGFMNPLVHLDTVPYAFNADKLGGLAASGFIQNTVSVQSSSNFNISGTGIAATALQAPVLQTASSVDLQIKPTTGIVKINTASVDNELRVFENNATPANYTSIKYGNISTNSGNLTVAAAGTTTIGNGTGAITIGSASTTSVNITGHAASTWQTDSGLLTISGSTSGLTLNTQTSGNVSLDSGTTGNVSIGTGANGKAISIGSTTAGTTVSVIGGTTANTAVSISTSGAGGITIDSGTTGNINIGTGANSKAVAIGNSQSSTTITATAGAVTETLSNTGDTLKTNTNSTTALQVQNSASVALLKIDTSSNNANNLLTNPSIESAISGNWTAKNGSGTSTPTQVSSPVYNASNSLQVVTSGTATNAGTTQNVTLSNSTDYVFSVYANSLSGFVSTAGAGTFDMGYGSGGTDTSCLTAQKVPVSAWTRFTCSFNTGTLGVTPYIYVKQTDATGRTFYLDSAVLETNPNGTSKWQDGKITLNGTINSPVIISPQQDSSNTFAVQNSNGINVFGIDTTDTNLVANPGVEVNTTGWTYNGTATGTAAISRDTSNSYLGVAGLKVINDSDATDGAKFTFSPNTLMQASTTYVLSFYAKDSAGSYATLTFGRSENGSQTNCVTTGAITTTWQRFSCSFTVGGTIGASPYVYLTAGTGSKTIYIDAVSLEPGSTAAPYGSASIYLNGVITSPVNFQNKTDSTTAFQIENAANSVTLFSVDTANNRITLGTGTGTSATVFVVGVKTDSGDPATCTSGGIYYNSTAGNNMFRACKNGTWVTLVAGVDVQDITATGTWTRPYGTSVVMVVLCGGGGSGGGGRGAAAGSARQGGTGGGGGSHVERIFNATDTVAVGSTVSVTVGVSVTGGASNGAGTAGNFSSFGTLAKAAGGGPGAAGPAAAAATSGAGGGGLVTVGTTASTSSINGGEGQGTAPTDGIGWAGGGATTGGIGRAAQFGGGGGGGTPLALGVGFAGGDSILGGGGGGGGGSVTAASPGTASNGAAGGGTGTFSSGGGGAAGAPGTAGSGGNSTHCGTGGGGGNSNNAATGGAGGAGGATTSAAGSPGGGGGGGGGGTATGGAGGAGARGEVWVFSW